MCSIENAEYSNVFVSSRNGLNYNMAVSDGWDAKLHATVLENAECVAFYV